MAVSRLEGEYYKGPWKSGKALGLCRAQFEEVAVGSQDGRVSSVTEGKSRISVPC